MYIPMVSDFFKSMFTNSEEYQRLNREKNENEHNTLIFSEGEDQDA